MLQVAKDHPLGTFLAKHLLPSIVRFQTVAVPDFLLIRNLWMMSIALRFLLLLLISYSVVALDSSSQLLAKETRAATDLARVKVTNIRRVFHNGEHNAFTDLCHFQGAFICCFREAKNHISGD